MPPKGSSFDSFRFIHPEVELLTRFQKQNFQVRIASHLIVEWGEDGAGTLAKFEHRPRISAPPFDTEGHHDRANLHFYTAPIQHSTPARTRLRALARDVPT